MAGRAVQVWPVVQRERERERDAVLQSLYGHPSDGSDLSSSSSAADCRQVELT